MKTNSNNRVAMIIGLVAGGLGIPSTIICWYIPFFIYMMTMGETSINLAAVPVAGGIGGSIIAIVFGRLAPKRPLLAGIMFLVAVILFGVSTLFIFWVPVLFMVALSLAALFSFWDHHRKIKQKKLKCSI